MRTTLIFLGIAFLFDKCRGLSWKEKTAFYQDCDIFNKTHIYGGSVCGSDGVTYANSLYLDCVNYHNFKHVATMHSGACLPGEDYCKTNLYYHPVCGSDNNTYTNLESLLCANYKYLKGVTVVSKEPCEKSDHCHRHGTEFYGINPVCGSNGLTYQNAAQVKCLQRYNKDLKILYDGGCLVRDVYGIYGLSEKVCEIARTRYEWNPVCASDSVTYPNPFVYLCYKPQLKVIADEECETHTRYSCAIIEADGTEPKNGRQVTETFGPDDEVCGNDGTTYKTIHHLECHTRQNKYLFLKHTGPCSGPDDNPCGSIPEEDYRLPVCGSDGSSYVSPEALWCAKLQSPERSLTFVHDGPC